LKKDLSAYTVLDVAHKAGICKATVLHVLNNQAHYIADETGKRAFGSSDELNYYKNVDEWPDCPQTIMSGLNSQNANSLFDSVSRE
jgi:hypothetical protein